MKMIEAVKTYQCPGCVDGPFDQCYTPRGTQDRACQKHCPGTRIMGIGRIFLGMPKGFSRLGACDQTGISIYETFEDDGADPMFNVPVWMHCDEHGNTLVNALSPRTNFPWKTIYLCDAREQLGCMEIMADDIAGMD